MPPEIQGMFRGHKDGTTQNVLAAISFDLKIRIVLEQSMVHMFVHLCHLKYKECSVVIKMEPRKMC